jgi:CHAD domain-containing protein
MRVGLRRLRAALSLWKGMVADARLGSIKSELKWMTTELGPARNLDVFASEMTAPARERQADDSGLSALLAEAARQRAQALESVQKAVSSLRFRRMCLDTMGWIEAGPWTKKGGTRAQEMRDRPAEAHAASELARRVRKIHKRGKRLARLDPRRRHRLRIAIKKVRYAADFFATLFPGGRAKKHRKHFIAVLKQLQSKLGQLNDIAGAETLGHDLAFGAARTSDNRRRSRRAFAAGRVTGLQEARVAPLLLAAEAAVKDFRKVKTFWT